MTQVPVRYLYVQATNTASADNIREVEENSQIQGTVHLSHMGSVVLVSSSKEEDKAVVRNLKYAIANSDRLRYTY